MFQTLFVGWAGTSIYPQIKYCCFCTEQYDLGYTTPTFSEKSTQHALQRDIRHRIVFSRLSNSCVSRACGSIVAHHEAIASLSGWFAHHNIDPSGLRHSRRSPTSDSREAAQPPLMGQNGYAVLSQACPLNSSRHNLSGTKWFPLLGSVLGSYGSP